MFVLHSLFDSCCLLTTASSPSHISRLYFKVIFQGHVSRLHFKVTFRG
ncbi:unnamed protein product [Acanthoscelides obtectus]|uniref:Uncharacterized protein n=1 Tax=Acanthoscelides obtectus TaxID=200917 RepID=A0A9P0QHX9_ACAOB|nr:unnamed protein product [Acanthoscelides obtectus]CAK1683576.1 hypothetical protein AOBTE_LOCUS34331 [Acanthoscelides obtectus]